MLRRQLHRSGLLLPGVLAAGSFAVMSGFARFGDVQPDFVGIDGWINSGPLSMARLHGSVALVNFWTYSCINSRRPMISLKRWHTGYGPLGLRLVGIHTPEFSFEHDRSKVDTYVQEEGISFPVGLDNRYDTWSAFRNEAWPAFCLLDRDGRITLWREGEDHAHEIERAIRDALGLARTDWVGQPGDDPELSRIGSPEMYFSEQHATPQDSTQYPHAGTAKYAFPPSGGPALDHYMGRVPWIGVGAVGK